jgi:shikimate kinase
VSEKNSIILIGMPGAGKSTVGILLSRHTGLDFIDTDIAIQVREGQTLQDIVDQQGYMKLRDIEQAVILEQSLKGAVVATGGSAVYGDRAMAYLAEHGVIVFIDVAIEELNKRLGDYERRGVARKPGQQFEDLYRERLQLYQRYADIQVTVTDETAEQVAALILTALAKR